MSVVVDYFGSSLSVVRSVVRRWSLLTALAKRDLSDEYVQHKFSVLWGYVMPLFTMVVYLLVFHFIWPTRVTPPEGYSTDATVYLLSGILPWLTLNQAVGRSISSIVNNGNIVKQMSFPLELLPLKSLVTPMMFMLVSLGFIIIYAGWVTRGTILPAYLIGTPVLLLLSVVTFAGLALLLSAVQVFTRDTKEFVAMFFQIGLFLHPILYLPQQIPEAVRGLTLISPFTYFIYCWQDILFYGEIVRPWAWYTAAGFAVLIFLIGSRLFMGSKAHFGDFL
jgi:lipopolysaccharide transport system permease protein